MRGEGVLGSKEVYLIATPFIENRCPSLKLAYSKHARVL
jgi:hypothetical protein